MSVFELAKLIPDPLIFVDTDGARYEALPVSALGAVDYARYTRMQREATVALGVLGSRDETVDKEAGARQLEHVTNELMQTIVPTLPIERVTAIAFGHKSQFLKWWQDEQPKSQVRAGELTAGKPVTPGRRSPASAGSTRRSRPSSS